MTGSSNGRPTARRSRSSADTDADGFGTYVYDLATGETRFVTDGTIESWVDNDHILVS